MQGHVVKTILDHPQSRRYFVRPFPQSALMQTALRYGLLALGMWLLGGCSSSPPYQYEHNDVIALESINGDNNVDDYYEYPALLSMEDDGALSSLPAGGLSPPPVPDIVGGDYAGHDITPREIPPPTVSAAAYSGSIESGSDISGIAHAYLSALYRGDGETAWRYAFVPYNPKQSWWDEQTAKGALLMKAGSSEYFAAEKQGVRNIEITPQSISPEDNAASVNARILYGNGSSSDLKLKMMNRGGKWLVPQE